MACDDSIQVPVYIKEGAIPRAYNAQDVEDSLIDVVIRAVEALPKQPRQILIKSVSPVRFRNSNTLLISVSHSEATPTRRQEPRTVTFFLMKNVS